MLNSANMQVLSSWRPYERSDHAKHFFGTLITASNDLSAVLPVASWARDTSKHEIVLQPSDLVIAGTDGFFDAVHILGLKGLDARRFVRQAYLEEQLDPGQLAERLLLRAWKTVQVRSLPVHTNFNVCGLVQATRHTCAVLQAVCNRLVSGECSVYSMTRTRHGCTAWLQDARGLNPEQIDTPFCNEVLRAGATDRYANMPEDDIAVVVSYVLQA